MLQERYIYAYLSGASFIFACIFLYLGFTSEKPEDLMNMLIGAIICLILTGLSVLFLITSSKRQNQEKITKI